jgi:UDP-N-acetylmuramyl pentapeptide synthase
MIASEAVKAGLKIAQVEYFPEAAAAGAIVRRLKEGDLVLLKASRAIGLEVLARAIFAGRSEPFAAAS